MGKKSEIQTVNIDVNRKLWHEVGIESAKLGINKKEFVERALREKVKKSQKGYEII